VQAFGVAAAAFLYLVIAAAGAAQSWGCSMRQVLQISLIKWRTPNHGQKRSTQSLLGAH